MESFAFEQEMSIIDKLYDKYNAFAEKHSEKLPESIYVKPIIRKVLIIIFFWGGIANAILFMFLYVSLYYGYNPFYLKDLV